MDQIKIILGQTASEALQYWQALPLLVKENDQFQQAYSHMQGISAAYPPAREVLLYTCLSRRDYTVLARQLTEWIEAGDTRSRKILGLLYYYGMGTKRDAVKARKWLESSVLTEADSECRCVLAYIYGSGLGMPADLERCREILKPLLDQDNAEAFCVLANIFAMKRDRNFSIIRIELVNIR